MIYKTDDELREILREQCKKLKSQKAWAEKNDFSAAYVCDMLRGKPLSENMAKKLGYKRVYIENSN